MRVAPPRLRIALALLCLAAAGGMTAAIAQGDDPPAAATFKTVESHVSSVLRKLQLSTRHELARWATQHRLV